MRDLPIQVVGGTYNPDQHNDMITEIENIITNTGQTLSAGDLRQIEKAVSIYAAGGSYYTESGVADAYVVSPVGSKTAPPSYFLGEIMTFIAGNANTGACTINSASRGVKNIKKADGSTDPEPGDISTTSPTTLVYDGTSFRLLGLRKSRLDVDGVLTAGTISEVFQRIYSTTVSTPTLSYTISGLDGNNDIEYILKIKANAGVMVGNNDIYLTINNDTGNNYYRTNMIVEGVNITSSSSLGINITTINDMASAASASASYIANIFAKSGSKRIIKDTSIIADDTSTRGTEGWHTWNNTADNIISIELTLDDADILGAGSTIDLYARR